MDTIFPPKARTMAELLPDIQGILSKDAVQTLTEKKQPRPAKAATLTSKRVLKPLTLAEMRNELKALKFKSPKMLPQAASPARKKWNSSVKVERKTVSHTADGQMKHNTVRKVLNFQQPKRQIPKTVASSARRTVNSETPKFPKPEAKTRRCLQPQGVNAVRISGICHIPDTPLSKSPPKNVNAISNKENVCNQHVTKKSAITLKSYLSKRIIASQISDTPLSNISWKSSCDASFLQCEKEIDILDGKNKALTEGNTLENIAVVSSPPVSTPFKEYRNINEFFSNSSDVIDNSSTSHQENTIMCFENATVGNENITREETVIVALCDILHKAKITNSNAENTCTELDLLKVEKHIVNQLEMIEHTFINLQGLKESQLKSLEHVRVLLDKAKQTRLASDSNNVKSAKKPIHLFKDDVELTPVVSKASSVIKSCLKSPSYKIPKKNMSCLHKKVNHKSMPNISEINMTPSKPMGDRAFNMYMEIKQNMDFLSTPVAKNNSSLITPNTPALTSLNLQLQLERLYGDK